ncbi:class A beta-lactamase-related serine hydrolase [Actinomadura logoneensis]|uniref:Class A beta-lactamase-related serine hydrolase n=1 Tax=Actinomadura logoneensis TaxID=2293572 RepID=A0A372JJP8_9ACTN|nr:serine hydrolase domain-containing protein [Actinomadura logoneensis]RFU40046.1 class A beta-lactamase-related serine hydrolase [Actinomadura logoneensis]
MRTRRTAVPVALGCALAVSAAVLPASASPSPRMSQARSAGPPSVQDILDRLPDAVVAGALVRRDGVEATAGPVPRDAYFRIGSVTKMFTNTVVLQLVAEHRIGLEAPARKYVPDVLPEAYGGVTVRQFLDHTSGLPKPAATPGPQDGPGWQLRSVSPAELLRRSFAEAPGAGPGTDPVQQYNGLNSLVLGLIVEKVTGHSFTGELKRRILRPLRLRHTLLPAPEDTVIPSPHAEVYVDGQDVTEQSPYPWAEGGMISTTADMDRFTTALFRGRLLPPAQQKLVFRVPNVAGGTENTNCPGGMACYSIGGLMRYRLPSGQEVWGKTGSRPGWDNGVFATRDLRHRVVYSLNPTGAGDDLPYIKALISAAVTDG